MKPHRSPGRLLSLALVLFLLNDSNAAAVAVNSPNRSLSVKQTEIPLQSARSVEAQRGFDGSRRYPLRKIMEGVVLPRDEPQPIPTGDLADDVSEEKNTEEKNAENSPADATMPTPEMTPAPQIDLPEHLAAMSAYARFHSREMQNHIDWVHAGESARSAGLWTPDAGQPIPTQFFTGLSYEELRRQNEPDKMIWDPQPTETQCAKRDGEQCLPGITLAPTPKFKEVSQEELDAYKRRYNREMQNHIDWVHAGESARSAGLWTPDAGQPIPTQFFTGLSNEELRRQNEADSTHKPSHCVRRSDETGAEGLEPECIPEITPAPTSGEVTQDDLDWAARRFSRQQQHLLDRFHAGESARSAGLWTPDAGQPIPTQFFTGLTFEEMMKQNEDDKSPHLTRKLAPTKCVKRSEQTGAADIASEGSSEVLVGVDPDGLVKMASEALVEGDESVIEEAPLPTEPVEEVYDPGYLDPMEYYADFQNFFGDMKSMKEEFTVPPNYKSDIGLPTPSMKASAVSVPVQTVVAGPVQEDGAEISVKQSKYHKYPPLPYFFDENDRAVRNSDNACINPYTGEVLWDPKDHVGEIRPNWPDYPKQYALKLDAIAEPAKIIKRERYPRLPYDIDEEGLPVRDEHDILMNPDTKESLYQNTDQPLSISEYYDDNGNPIRNKLGVLINPAAGEEFYESLVYPVKRPNYPDHLEYYAGRVGPNGFMPPNCNGKAYDPRMYWCDQQWKNHDPCPVTFDHREANQPSFVRWQPCGKGCYNPMDDQCSIDQSEPAVPAVPAGDAQKESFKGVFTPQWSEQYAKDELQFPYSQDPGPQLEDLYDYEFFINAQYFVPHDLGLPYVDAPMCGKKAYDPRLYYCANEMNVCPVHRQGVSYPEHYAAMYKGCEEGHGTRKSEGSRPQKSNGGCCHGGKEK